MLLLSSGFWICISQNKNFWSGAELLGDTTLIVNLNEGNIVARSGKNLKFKKILIQQ